MVLPSKEKEEGFMEPIYAGMDDANIDFFVDGCVRGQMKQIVENSGSTLADREYKSDDEDIKKMKKIALANIEYVIPSKNDLSKFEVRDKETNNYVLFSNRVTEVELRGPNLRKRLDELKENKRQQNLYDALNFLIADPKLIVTYFCGGYKFAGINKEDKDILINGLTKLAQACIDYVKDVKAQEVKEEKAIGLLKKVLKIDKKEILKFAFDDKVSVSDLFKYINELMENYSRLIQFFGSDAEIGELFLANRIIAPQKTDLTVGLGLAKKFRNLENTEKLLRELSGQGFIGGDKKKVQQVKNQIYFSKLDDEIREIIREIQPVIHVDKPGIYLSAWKALGYASTTHCVIDGLNRLFQDGKKTGDFNLLKDDLKLLGLDDQQVERAINQIKNRLKEEVPEQGISPRM